MKEVRERGLRIPEDVSVTGFDNVKLSEFCDPALTTVHIPRDLIGHTVFISLVPEAGRAGRGREIVINPELVLRESIGPARHLAASA
jgi:DNA-binding LacI/PurR family transcriptional regulator